MILGIVDIGVYFQWPPSCLTIVCQMSDWQSKEEGIAKILQ